MDDFIPIFEDNHLFVVEKRAGIGVQSDKSGDSSLIELAKDDIKIKYDKLGNVYLGLVHRIDRPVGGLVVLAKTSKAHSRLSDLFRRRKVFKAYLAIVDGVPQHQEELLDAFLIKDRRMNKSFIVKPSNKDSKQALTKYVLIASNGKHSLVLVSPLTGRHHQIRVQLSGLGFPIVGDVKYGGSRHYDPKSICLFACAISFRHPVRGEVCKLTVFPKHKGSWSMFSDFLNKQTIEPYIESLMPKD